MAYHHDRAPIKNTTKEHKQNGIARVTDKFHRVLHPGDLSPGAVQYGANVMTAQTSTGDKPFYLRSGELSAYGLACGYVEKTQLAPDFKVELYREGNAYHVRAFPTYEDPQTIRVWEVFDALTPARAFYRKTIRECRP